MIRSFVVCLCFILGGILFSLNAQERQESDTSYIRQRGKSPVYFGQGGDTLSTPAVRTEKPVVLNDSLTFEKKEEFKPDPKKAVIYSAIFPGLGQMYNRRYWKLPIVYGGFIGLSYAISWNGTRYNEYTGAYQDLVLNVPEAEGRYRSFLPPGMTLEEYGPDRLQSKLRRGKDFFRRNRDLAIIATIGLYALCMIDAYVDAHLYDFDISPDLSMRVQPVFWTPTAYSKATFGLQCSINF